MRRTACGALCTPMRVRRLPKPADARGQRAGLRRAGHLLKELGVSGGSTCTFHAEQTPAVPFGDLATGSGCLSERGSVTFCYGDHDCARSVRSGLGLRLQDPAAAQRVRTERVAPSACHGLLTGAWWSERGIPQAVKASVRHDMSARCDCVPTGHGQRQCVGQRSRSSWSRRRCGSRPQWVSSLDRCVHSPRPARCQMRRGPAGRRGEEPVSAIFASAANTTAAMNSREWRCGGCAGGVAWPGAPAAMHRVRTAEKTCHPDQVPGDHDRATSGREPPEATADAGR